LAKSKIKKRRPPTAEGFYASNFAIKRRKVRFIGKIDAQMLEERLKRERARKYVAEKRAEKRAEISDRDHEPRDVVDAFTRLRLPSG
jgi:hypothetical protein